MLKTTLIFIAFFASTPCLAVPPVKSTSGLNFRDLEFQQPRDPLLSSNVVFNDVHHTPTLQLQGATAALLKAIPYGMSRMVAEATLRNAGAHCALVSGSNVDQCHFFDLETVDEFSDDILWNVRMNIVDDKVMGLSVDRTWQRH